MKIQFQLSALKRTSLADYGVRFVFGGAITVLAGIIAKEYGPALGGLFLAFPAIFPATSTLIEANERQQKIDRGKSGRMRGRLVAALDARGGIWGSAGLMCFAAFVWTLLPRWNAAGNLLAALAVWTAASVIFWRLSRWIRLTQRRKRSAASHARRSEGHPAEHLRG
jgi:Protein of unknown function (DUF3147)